MKRVKRVKRVADATATAPRGRGLVTSERTRRQAQRAAAAALSARFHDRLIVAHRLEQAGRIAEARDELLVVADAAEEAGDKPTSIGAKRRATMLHVLDWAQRRWPAEEFTDWDVEFRQLPPTKRRSRVELSVRRQATVPRSWVYVTVGRRGDIREEKKA